jgi:hypothetical protein
MSARYRKARIGWSAWVGSREVVAAPAGSSARYGSICTDTESQRGVVGPGLGCRRGQKRAQVGRGGQSARVGLLREDRSCSVNAK